MQEKKKIGALLLSVSVAMAALAGCAGGDKNTGASGSPSPSSSVKPAESAKPEEPIKLTIKPQNDKQQDPNSAVTKEIEKLFNVKIEYVYLDRSKDAELLNLRISSGEIPDVMMLSPALFSSYSQQGILAEIPMDLIEKHAPTWLKQVKQNGGENILEFYKVNGKLYGLPMITSDAYNYVPIWRDDWLKNVGIDKIPASLKEAEEAFYKFVNEDPDKNGKKDTYALSNFGIKAVYGAFGLQPSIWMERDGGVKYSSLLPEMKDALTLLNKWYKDGLIDPEFITGENKGQYWANTVSMWNGKIGFSVPGTYYHVNPKLNPDDPSDLGSGNWQNFKKLQGESATYAPGMPLVGPTGLSGIEKWGVTSGSAVGLGKDVAKDPKKMIKWLQMIEKLNTDEEYYRLAQFGIKGEMWDINPVTSLPTMKEEFKDKKGIIAAGPSGTAFQMSNFDMVRKNTMSPQLLEFAKKYAMVTDKYEQVVWAALPSDGKYKANLDKKIGETTIQFITGQKKLDEWDKYVEEMNTKYGLNELTQEANDWYTKYKKK